MTNGGTFQTSSHNATSFATSRRALISRLVVMMYVRLRLSLRNVEDLLHEGGIDLSHSQS